MSDTKWTPGPYEVEDEYAIAVQGAPLAVVFDSSEFPCADESEYDRIDDEARATAALFSAAPDLYEALEGLLEICSSRRKHSATETSWMELAASILAKARGESCD